MSLGDIEVEIKVKITKSKFDSIKQKLKKTCKFIDKTHHIDTYYNSAHKNFLKPKYPYEWLSLRKRGGKILLNYKHWYPQGVKHTTHCDEYEINVDSQNQLEKILRALGVKKIITVDKKRLTYIYKNKIEIALDEVKRLGYFIEAEALKSMGSLDETYKQLEEYLNSLGINNIRIIPGGYAAEMMRKKGLMKN